MRAEELAIYPGGDLVAKGLDDLSRGVVTEEALLVSIASSNLIGLGFEVPELKGVPLPHEHALYEMIEDRMPRGAHMAYNSLIARLVSFENTYCR